MLLRNSQNLLAAHQPLMTVYFIQAEFNMLWSPRDTWMNLELILLLIAE